MSTLDWQGNDSFTWTKMAPNKVQISHSWKIDELGSMDRFKLGDFLESTDMNFKGFMSDGKSLEVEVVLKLYPLGDTDQADSFVKVVHLNDDENIFKTKVEFGLEKPCGEQLITGEGRGIFKWLVLHQQLNTWNVQPSEQNRLFYEQNPFGPDLVRQLMPDRRLTVVSTIEVNFCDEQLEGKMETETLGDQLAKSLNNSRFSDVTLTCGEQSFKCHKAILSARSDVFNAMFSHSATKEGITNEVVITDIEPQVLEKLLCFIYTDQCEGIATLALSLMAAAHKYNIPQLQLICGEAIIANLLVDNVADTLVHAYRYEAKDLQAAVIRFASYNFAAMAKTPAWKIIATNQPAILNDILVYNMTKK